MSETEFVKPEDIEKRSFEIIESEIKNLTGGSVPQDIKPILFRVIHTTADFDYLENLFFSEGAVEKALETIKSGAVIVTDTNMCLAGINKNALKKAGCEAVCFMADSEVREYALKNNTTRAVASVERARSIKDRPVIYAVGNAPTALLKISEYIENGVFRPDFVIGVPVGFVNVVQSKERIIKTGVPCIVARGRKGGSTVATAICNALLYMIDG